MCEIDCKVSVDLTAVAITIGQDKLRKRLLKKLGGDESTAPAADGTTPEAQQQSEQPPKDSKDEARDQLKKSLFDLFDK